jgi:8-oxo-dGTP pyrophosphatase MutT (NUDIX family)
MRIKIYFNEKTVFLCDELSDDLKEMQQHPSTIYIDEVTTAIVKNVLEKIEDKNVDTVILFATNMAHVKQLFFSQFTAIEAAGGIVKNDKEELLFIYRLNKWDLPKGKIELGENETEAAVREVTEETGLQQLKVKSKLTETYHTYKAYGKYFLKTTHWYFMNGTTNQQLIPQAEEDITEVKWIPKNNLDSVLCNMYPSIKDVITIFLAVDK